MLYLSEIKGAKVVDPAGTEIGRLADVAVVPKEQFPAVQWAILRAPVPPASMLARSWGRRRSLRSLARKAEVLDRSLKDLNGRIERLANRTRSRRHHSDEDSRP